MKSKTGIKIRSTLILPFKLIAVLIVWVGTDNSLEECYLGVIKNDYSWINKQIESHEE